MNYKELSSAIAESFVGYITSFNDENPINEQEIKSEIEEYGCDFGEPNTSLVYSSIRCAMDRCGLDQRQISEILKCPDSYSMNFPPLSEKDNRHYSSIPHESLYDPYLYEDNGKTYISFHPIEITSRNGMFFRTDEFNLVYCVDDDMWSGDSIMFDELCDMDSVDAADMARKHDFDKIAKDVLKERNDEAVSLEREVSDARESAKDLADGSIDIRQHER